MNKLDVTMPEIFSYVALIVCSDALMCEFWNIPHHTSPPPTAMGSYFVHPLHLLTSKLLFTEISAKRPDAYSDCSGRSGYS
jgi:hypothetical protein